MTSEDSASQSESEVGSKKLKKMKRRNEEMAKNKKGSTKKVVVNTFASVTRFQCLIMFMTETVELIS